MLKVRQPERKSRIETLKENNAESPHLELPDLEGFSYLVDYLFEVGPGVSSGMGYCSLTFQEIESWLRTTALNLTAWEALALKKLSSAYVAEYNQADDPQRPPPYIKFEEGRLQPDRSEELKRFFRSLQGRGIKNGSGNVGNRGGQPKGKNG